METRSGKLLKPSEKQKRKVPPISLFDDNWLEVYKLLNKVDFRSLSEVNRELYTLSKTHYRLFQHASRPSLDYKKFLSYKFIKKAFEWDNISTSGEVKPTPYFFENGDIAVSEDDGKINVLRFGDSEWREFGAHTEKLIDGRVRNYTVRDIVSLDSGDLASCAYDGIRIWDWKLGCEKYKIKLPGAGAFCSKPTKLFPLSPTEFACSTLDGGVHLLRMQPCQLEGIFKYQYQFSYPFIDHEQNFFLNQLIRLENELIGVFPHFIMRWNWQTGEILARIDFFDLKVKLFDSLVNVFGGEVILNFATQIHRHRLREVNHMDLQLKRHLLNGFVEITINEKYSFLLSLIDPNIAPFYLGECEDFLLGITNTQDLCYFDKTASSLYFRWNPKENHFSLETRISDTSHGDRFALLPNGDLLVHEIDYFYAWIFDRETGQEKETELELPEDCVIKTLDFLGEDHLMGTDGKSFYIWDKMTGLAQFVLHTTEKNFKALPSGDIIKMGSKITHNGYHSDEYDGIYTGEDEFEVYRFGLKQ